MAFIIHFFAGEHKDFNTRDMILSTYEKLPVNFSAFQFYKTEDGVEEPVVVDLSDFAERCITYEKENPDAWETDFSEAMKLYSQIALDDGSMLYINDFLVRYEDGIKDGEAYFEIESVDVEGMLLSR